MRQRVAVARALATEPDILLLDEPLSALDALTRAKLQDEIARDLASSDGRRVVLITNDVDEAILLADRIIPLKPGPERDARPRVQGRRCRGRATAPRSTHDPAFKRLRAEITALLCSGVSAQAAARRREPPVPRVISLAEEAPPPKAYQAAAASPIEDRYVEFFKLSEDLRDARRARSPWSTAST